MNEGMLADLLTESELALSSILPSAGDAAPRGMRSYSLEEFADKPPRAAAGEKLELRIELGRTQLRFDEARNLRNGSVVAFNDMTGEPVSVYAGRRRVGRGELLVRNGKIAVRMVEIEKT
ncbi:MAG: FliM/FliN family flagellar motor switch protein [Pirellulaceae bacterium]|nr:FliM/FliN family flagellar motor switch protein [Pirellulaceae bacterium]